MTNISKFLYGGDYNPEQWPRHTIDQDLALLKKAHINSHTINVFAWSRLEPEEGVYDFADLDDTVARLTDTGSAIVLGTSTAAMPAWLFRLYPEVGRVDYEGRRHRFSGRHNFCPTSPAYRRAAGRLTEQLALRYSDSPNLALWHIGNEYAGRCYCELCETGFREWLQTWYSTIEAVNEAWNMDFWGHRIYAWEDITVPNLLGEGMEDGRSNFAGLSLDYDRFQSAQLLECFCMERDIIRRYDCSTPITNNLMGTYKELDYFRWAREIDIVSWDNYPGIDEAPAYTSMRHDLMRSLKHQPFLLMEQTPSQQNWMPYNYLKRPGQMKAMSMQAVAHGADSVQFFQLKQSRGACEKFHGAVISHAGHGDTRVFREVASLGEELGRVGASILGAVTSPEVAIIFDWEAYWGLEYTSGPSVALRYVNEVYRYYEALYSLNVPVEFVHPEDDLSPYKAVAAPVLYLTSQETCKRIAGYVEQGGVLLTTYMSFVADINDNVWLGTDTPMRQVLGLWVEEIDALKPDRYNRLLPVDERSGLPPEGAACHLVFAQLRTDATCETLAVYASDFYEGQPALTVNPYGDGKAYYLGSPLVSEGARGLMRSVLQEAKVTMREDLPAELDYMVRAQEDYEIVFLVNPKPAPLSFANNWTEAEVLLASENAALTDGAVELGGFSYVLLKVKKP